MIILVLNCGSSSIKYSLFSMGTAEKRLARGYIDRLGFADSRLIQELPGPKKEHPMKVKDHSHAISMLLNVLAHPDSGILPSLDYIDIVGHRVVHGGDRLSESVKIDENVIEYLKNRSYLAPLHNPPNLAGIEAATNLLPRSAQVAVFDTAFHQTLPEHAYIYALPYELYEKYGIRRYGFHGISHRFMMKEAARILNKPEDQLRLITCHLGNGSSITAIKFGRSVDTSMGFTPLEGLPMGTRCGDIDPAIVLFLQEQEGLDPASMGDLLNKKSGMAGLSCHSSDMREILKAAYLSDVKSEDCCCSNLTVSHQKKSKLALNIYIYRIKKYIGSYAAAMGGVDAVIFTGGIGQNPSVIQEEACAGLQFMGVETGSFRNMGNGCFELSTPNSKAKVFTVPTDEELMIARDTLMVLQTFG